jgi:prophage regulatory protein
MPENVTPPPYRTILRLPALQARVPVAETTFWRWEQKGLFPRRVRLGPNTVGWYEDEVQAWLGTRPAAEIDARRPSPNPRARTTKASR